MASNHEQENGRSLFYQIFVGGIRDFVWSDLNEGRLRLNGLSRPVQLIIISGFLVILYTLGLIIFSDTLRNQETLIPLTYTRATSGRGALVPQSLVPQTLFVITMGWSFLLAGSIRINRWLKYFLIYVYLLLFMQMFFTFIGALSVSFVNARRIIQVGLALISYFTIAVVLIYRSFRPPRPGVEFGVIFFLNSLLVGMASISMVDALEEFGTSLGIASLEVFLSSMTILVLGFVIFIGMEIARFVRKLSGWSSEIIAFRLPASTLRASLVVIIVLLLIELFQEGRTYLAQRALQDSLLGLVSGAVIIGVVLIFWRIFKRWAGETRPFIQEEALDNIVDKYSLYIISGLVAAAVFNVAILLLLPILTLVNATSLVDRLNSITQFVTDQTDWFVIIFGAFILLWGMRVGWQKRPFSGLFLSIAGFQIVWFRLTDPGRPLEVLNWQGSFPVDFWWMLLLLGLTAVWFRRKQLSPARTINLIFLMLIVLILQQTDFIEDPFSPFLSFAGVAFLAFGILWDILTIGSWANNSSKNFPRLSRIYLYLGYVLITAAAINWSFSQHNLFWVEQFTGNGALLGLDTVGRPMLYILFPMLLFQSSSEAETFFQEVKNEQSG